MSGARWLIAVVAVLACVWFVFGIRQADDLAAAQHILAGPNPVGGAQAVHARSLLAAAGTLNPDEAVDISRGRLDLAQGDIAAARQVLGRVVQREPANLEAWVALAEAAYGTPQSRVILARLHSLDPLDIRTR